MSITLSATSLAVSPGIQASFSASGGTSPYTFYVRSSGAGGTIDSSTGLYTAPNAYGIDTVAVTDSTGAFATAQIQSSTVLQLLLDVVKTEMSLPMERAYLYNQKTFQPFDAGIYCAFGIMQCKPYGSTNLFDGADLVSQQSVNMQGTFWIEVMSGDTSALLNKEQVIIALNSDYSRYQQSLNNFFISPITTGFTDISQVDGAEIPYRYHLTLNVLYLATKVKSTDYFDSFQTTTVTTEP